jgi:hypothetical protein
MATQSQIEETYKYMNEFFRAPYGEHADCTGCRAFDNAIVGNCATEDG